MKKKQKNKKLYILLVITIILLLITFCCWFGYISLRVNKPIVSNNLIIEGWIPGCAVESKQVKNIISHHNNVYFSGIAASFQEDIFTSPMQYGRCDKGLVSNGALYLFCPLFCVIG
ncbi:MAG: hypothetical protein IPO21_18140 [Bacteroidales bacterium]|nr:hypothetical protein [Bacteroidales bacterium]